VADVPLPAPLVVSRDRAGFEQFAATHQERFRDAMVARYGPQQGSEASAAAMAYAWEHWDRVATMDRPCAYLFRVAQSSLRPQWRWLQRRVATFPAELGVDDSLRDVDLGAALSRLSQQQRMCVLLIHAYDWSYREVAEFSGLSETAVTNHVARGRTRLRALLAEELSEEMDLDA
jgi:DNA-directed RNA polymerase specialized sigma24 family protein